MSAVISHIGFADESHWNSGRFRAIGLVTLPLSAFDAHHRELIQHLKASGVREFKWKKLNGAKDRFAAQKLFDFAIEAASKGTLRVDVLIWDTQDSRHRIKGRDDIANLQRMYYHLFHNVLRERWPNDAIWRLHPDEHTAMDWNTVQDCLEHVANRLEMERLLFTMGQFRDRLRREFMLEEIQPVRSPEQPMLQLADLFAGIAVFSRDQFDAYQKWLAANGPQLELFDDQNDAPDASRISRERFLVLKYLDDACKKNKLGVSLNRKRGLWTPKPKNPLNFWMYEPQHPEDKAPAKMRQ